jgi:glycosyltransferase involved in cell wall biosynthesis
LEIRDLWPAFAIDMGVLKNAVLIRAARALEKFLYRRATHLLVNSPAYRKYLVEQGVPLSKITLIPNGVDTAMFHPEENGECRRREFGVEKCFVVVYAGALGVANDIPLILRAADRLRTEADVRFILVGDGKERRALVQRAQEMKLTNVIFTGARPKSEMPSFVAAADACVAALQNIPMFRTTYPNKVFDYMAAGRPTILAIDGVIRDVIERARGGLFVSPGDDQALAEAVLKLKSSPATARDMGRAARAYVVEHFNRSEQAAGFVALLERVAPRASPLQSSFECNAR